MKTGTKLHLLFTLLLIAVVLITGCGGNNDQPVENGTQEDPEAVETISYEEAVIDEDTLVTSGVVNKTVEIKEGFTKEEVMPLLEEIASDLKEEYPDAKITVSAISGGTGIGQVEIDK